ARRAAARDEAVEDRLDLVGGGVTGRTQALTCDGIALVAQLGLAEAAPVQLDDLGTERLAAEARVLVRLGAAQPVVHVQRGDAVAELAQRVPEAGRVGAAGDEAADLAARLDQLVPADQLLDPRAQGRRLHRSMVRRGRRFESVRGL